MALFDRKNECTAFPFSSLRILPYQVFSGAVNMALDFYLAQTIRRNDVPILRFYGWSPYCLSVGYHQDDSLIDFKNIAEQGYQVVRRPTGGSAIFHSTELTYALIVPNINIKHHDLYKTFHRLLSLALNSLGFPVELNTSPDNENYLKQGKRRFACFNRPAFSEIQYAGKKVVGSAQKLYQNALLQHGSILIGPHQRAIVGFLKLDKKEKERYLQKLKHRSISLSEIAPHLPIDPLQIAEALLGQFEHAWHLKLYYQALTTADVTRAQKFVDQFKIQ